MLCGCVQRFKKQTLSSRKANANPHMGRKGIMADVMTEYGIAREIHVIAAKRIFDDMVKRVIERQILIQRAKRIEQLSPAAGFLLRDWIVSWNSSCAGLKPEEVPDTDSEF